MLDSATSATSATSVIGTETANQMTNDTPKEMYHVVFDSDFGNFYNKKNITKEIQFVYDKNEAIRIANKLLNLAVNKGSYGSGNDKKYPFIGMVVVCFKLKDETNSNLQNDEKNGQNLPKRSLSVDDVSKIEFVSGIYVVREDVKPSDGFALLNTVPQLTVEDISKLKSLYDNNSTSNAKEVALGAGNYYEDYVRQKALHIKNKLSQSNNDDIYKVLYQKQKKIYKEEKNKSQKPI